MTKKIHPALRPYFEKNRIEAGCDEAGRGCLAGPVYAAAVILPPQFNHPDLNDSKQLTARQREKLRPIIEKEAIAWAVVAVSAQEIDQINILNASIEAMKRAVDRLEVTPQHLLIDGNRFKAHATVAHTCIIKGDAIYKSIAAASVLAKTYRDDYMIKLSQEYPQYAWQKNKGYPTKEHRAGIQEYGPSPFHRLTFKLLASTPTNSKPTASTPTNSETV